MKINKYTILGILLTSFLIGLIVTNVFNSDFNSKAEGKENNKFNELEKKPISSDPFIPTPNIPHENLKWNFTSNTTKAFHWITNTEGMGSFFGVNYYNITSMPYVHNKSGSYISGWEYCVGLQELYFNTTKNTLLPNPLNPDPVYVSFLNLTETPISYFFPESVGSDEEEEEGPGPNPFLLNAFIPTNGSNGLALNWSASHLKLFYDILLSPGSSVTVDKSSRNIYFQSLDTTHYVNLTYDQDGILKIGKASFQVEGIHTDILIIVDNNTNPIDEIEWNVKEGDELYYGIGLNEYKFNVTKIVNETYVFEGIGFLVVETIHANASVWQYGFGWRTVQDREFRIGVANEIYPLFMLNDTIPFILPKKYDMKFIAELYKMMAENRYDQVTNGLT